MVHLLSRGNTLISRSTKKYWPTSCLVSRRQTHIQTWHLCYLKSLRIVLKCGLSLVDGTETWIHHFPHGDTLMRTAPHLGKQSPSHCLPSKEHRQKVSASPFSPVLDQGAGNSATGNEWSSQAGGSKLMQLHLIWGYCHRYRHTRLCAAHNLLCGVTLFIFITLADLVKGHRCAHLLVSKH
jgi:hypothetical protein